MQWFNDTYEAKSTFSILERQFRKNRSPINILQFKQATIIKYIHRS